MAQNQQTRGAPPSGGNNARAEQIGRVQNTRRRRRRGNYTLCYILLGLVLTIVCVVLSLTVFFNVHTITATGSSIYQAEQILAAVDVKTGDNLLRLNTGRISERALSLLTRADTVELKRHFPDKLEIIVTDGEPALQVSQDGIFYQFTESGRLVGISQSAVTNAQVVLGPDVSGLSEGQYLTDLTDEQQQTLSDWRTIRNELWNYSIHDISAMDLSDELGMSLYYQNRIEIYIGTLTDMDAKMATLQAILYDSGLVGVDEVGRIDLSNPDRVYFNNQTACTPPDGAGQLGWSWEDPYSAALEEILYAVPEPEVTPEEAEAADSEEGEPDADGESDSTGESAPAESDSAEGTAESAAEADSGEESSSEEEDTSSESYQTSGGMRLPQLPTVGGTAESSGSTDSSSAPSVPTVSSSEPESSSAETSSAGDSSAPAQIGAAGSASGGNGTNGVGTQAPSVPSIGH